MSGKRCSTFARCQADRVIDDQVTTSDNAQVDVTRFIASGGRDDRAAAQAPATGTQPVAAGARCPWSLLRLYLSDRSWHAAALGEGPQAPRHEPWRHRRLPGDRLAAGAGRAPGASASRISSSRSGSATRPTSSTSSSALLQEAVAAGDRPRPCAPGSRSRPSPAKRRMVDGRRVARGRPRGEHFAPVDRYEIYAISAAPMPFPAACTMRSSCTSAASGRRRRGGDPALEARYATLLSYALTDIGELARAEEVVARRSSASTRRRPVHARAPLLVDGAPRARRGRASSRSTTFARRSRSSRRPTTRLHLARAHILAA